MAPIMIVDDDGAVRDALRFALELEGFAVVTYASAEDLLADENCPEDGCLVVDQIMPGMSGLQLIEALRERQCTLPTILITSGTDPTLRRRAARAGLDHILEKPLSDSGLIETIRSVTAGTVQPPAAARDGLP